MKRSLSILLFTFLVKYSLGQTYPIVGAWNSLDSGKEVSLFFKHDGNMSMHSGSKNAPILNADLKKGKYIMTGNFVTITWEDQKIEKNKIKFLNKYSFTLTLIDKTSSEPKRRITFRRIVDEEVVK